MSASIPPGGPPRGERSLVAVPALDLSAGGDLGRSGATWTLPVSLESLSQPAVAELLAMAARRSAEPGVLFDAALGTRVSGPVSRRLQCAHAVTRVSVSSLVDAALYLLLPTLADVARLIEGSEPV
jgi:hypothetical protein